MSVALMASSALSAIEESSSVLFSNNFPIRATIRVRCSLNWIENPAFIYGINDFIVV